MSAGERRAQVLAIAAGEFADHGLHGASTEAIARAAGISQPYVFRMFGTKKALFLELVGAAFDRVADGMAEAAAGRAGLEGLAPMGRQYYDLLADRTSLLLQLQGFAACGDAEVREVVRSRFARLWDVAAGTGLDAITVKTFLAYGMLLNTGAALGVDEVDEPWALGVRTRVRAGLFEHVTSESNT